MGWIFSFLLALLVTSWEARAMTSCECEQTTCGACETEAGVSFYSAKCGEGDAKVKSCKKPRCQPVENQQQCLAKLSSSAIHAAVEKPVDATSADGPAPAVAGQMTQLQGQVLITHLDGRTEPGREGAHVAVGDFVETKADGKVSIRLVDHSELVIAPATRLQMEKAQVDEGTARRHILLNLLQGKVRSRVEKKNDGTSSYEVRTRAAVAGVRGTDFVTSFEAGDKQWISRVQTFEGRVHLESLRPSSESGVEVTGGTQASFVMEKPERSEEADADALTKLMQKGYLTPVIKMTSDEQKSLKDETELAARRQTASVPEPATSEAAQAVCTEPAGQYNQCSFTCSEFAKGETHCQACVRRICRANGAWADATRLPLKESDRCSTSGVVVRDCGGYW